MQETEFEINRSAVKNYFLTVLMLVSLVCCLLPTFCGFAGVLDNPHKLQDPTFPLTLALMFIGIPSVILVPCFVFGCWLCPQKANNLRYRLVGSTFRADGGVFFLFRKSIPLERITDIALVQGPLLRYFAIWAMRIQTAGSAQCEATLYGVREPEKIRELILAQRKSAYGEKTEDACGYYRNNKSIISQPWSNRYEESFADSSS